MNGQVLNVTACGSWKLNARRALLCSIGVMSLIIGAAGSAQAASAHHGDTKVVFNIPTQSLEAGLLSFAQQSGIQLVLNSSDVQGFRSPAIVGAITPAKALQQVLGSSPLSAKWVSNRTVAIRPQVARLRPVAMQAAVPVSPASAPGHPQ